MYVFKLAWQSLLNRRFTTILTLASVALSIALLLGVERVRHGARDSFANTISGTDLIVGAKGGTVQLLLYSVFRMGAATDNISYETYEDIANWESIDWTIPYSLGDSHRGFRVVGTNDSFYQHYRYRRSGKIEFAAGKPPAELFEVALGNDVARKLGYKLGDKITLSHGISDVSFQDHEDKPFTVVGILDRTATPIDRSLYVTLEGVEAIHIDWTDGAPPVPGQEISPDQLLEETIAINQITAFLVGAKSRLDVLQLQRDINEYLEEPVMAVIPGVALSELWEAISYAEDGLRVVSMFVVLVGLIGLLVSIYNSLNERRREMAILRSVGAGPGLIFSLLVIESFLLTAIGALFGVALMYLIFFTGQPIIEREFGIFLPIKPLQSMEWIYLGVVAILGLALGAVPALRAYRNTLSDGLTIRI